LLYQRHPATTTHTRARADYAGTDTVDYATNHGDHAEHPRKQECAAAAAKRQVG
jgi:hypothetical protein